MGHAPPRCSHPPPLPPPPHTPLLPITHSHTPPSAYPTHHPQQFLLPGKSHPPARSFKKKLFYVHSDLLELHESKMAITWTQECTTKAHSGQGSQHHQRRSTASPCFPDQPQGNQAEAARSPGPGQPGSQWVGLRQPGSQRVGQSAALVHATPQPPPREHAELFEGRRRSSLCRQPSRRLRSQHARGWRPCSRRPPGRRPLSGHPRGRRHHSGCLLGWNRSRRPCGGRCRTRRLRSRWRPSRLVERPACSATQCCGRGRG
jgi:hypothetical protein